MQQKEALIFCIVEACILIGSIIFFIKIGQTRKWIFHTQFQSQKQEKNDSYLLENAQYIALSRGFSSNIRKMQFLLKKKKKNKRKLKKELKKRNSK